MKKYLVLGGNGFIGNNLCKYIADQGEEVFCFDRKKPVNSNPKVHYIQGDFFDEEFLKSMIEDFDVIFHAISTINPGNSNNKYLSGYGRDLVQTIKLCSWIKGSEKCLVFLSSGGTVYGRQEIQPITEQALSTPINHYGNVKLSIENAMRIFGLQNSLNVKIARISNPYGPGQDYTEGVGFIDAALKRAMNKQVVEIYGNGKIVRDYIYITDVCYYLYHLAQYTGEEIVFNISSGVGTSQNEVIKYISDLGIDVSVQYKALRSVDVEKIVLDNTKITTIYGNHITSFKNGLEHYYKHLLEIQYKEKQEKYNE